MPFRLVYFEKFLTEYWEEVDYPDFSRAEPRWKWETYLKIEDFEDASDAIKRAGELMQMIDYDHDIVILGIFKEGKMVYSPDIVRLYAEDVWIRSFANSLSKR